MQTEPDDDPATRSQFQAHYPRSLNAYSLGFPTCSDQSSVFRSITSVASAAGATTAYYGFIPEFVYLYRAPPRLSQIFL